MHSPKFVVGGVRFLKVRRRWSVDHPKVVVVQDPTYKDLGHVDDVDVQFYLHQTLWTLTVSKSPLSTPWPTKPLNRLSIPTKNLGFSKI